jgi:aryl-alcohol dehydrogenase-like predicted oxidoreductase
VQFHRHRALRTRKSETIVGKALKDKREDIVLCTKVFALLGNSPNHSGLSRLNLMRAVEDSLKRLQTDHIDLYLLHRFDPETPLKETLRALDDMVRQGKVRYIGCSRFQAWKIMEALWISDVRSLDPFVCIQDQYNLLNRLELEPDLMPLCREHGLGIMVYSPLAIGLLSGRFRRGQEPPANTPWGKGTLRGLSSPSKYVLRRR